MKAWRKVMKSKHITEQLGFRLYSTVRLTLECGHTKDYPKSLYPQTRARCFRCENQET